MPSYVELALKALIQKLERRIDRAERQLGKDREARDEAYDLYAKLTNDHSVVELKALPKTPAPHLHQAILLAASKAGDDGAEFADLVSFVESSGIATTDKSVRATAHRLVHEGRLTRKGAGYIISRSGEVKLATLQGVYPVHRDVIAAGPKKKVGRTRRPRLSLR